MHEICRRHVIGLFACWLSPDRSLLWARGMLVNVDIVVICLFDPEYNTVQFYINLCEIGPTTENGA
jgi:hypothetical protein